MSFTFITCIDKLVHLRFFLQGHEVEKNKHLPQYDFT